MQHDLGIVVRAELGNALLTDPVYGDRGVKSRVYNCGDKANTSGLWIQWRPEFPEEASRTIWMLRQDWQQANRCPGRR